MKKQDRDEFRTQLKESFLRKAREIGPNAFFWDKMTDAILNSEIPELKPRDFRKPAHLNDLVNKVHCFIHKNPQEIDHKLKQFYLGLIKLILRELDY